MGAKKKRCVCSKYAIKLSRSKYFWCTKCGALGYLQKNNRYRWRIPGTRIEEQ